MPHIRLAATEEFSSYYNGVQGCAFFAIEYPNKLKMWKQMPLNFYKQHCSPCIAFVFYYVS